jgi:hypothetical protein
MFAYTEAATYTTTTDVRTYAKVDTVYDLHKHILRLTGVRTHSLL